MNNRFDVIFPEKIRCIAVVAPAGLPDRCKLTAALEKLGKTVKVKNFTASRSDDTPDYLAADAAVRSAGMNAAINDPEVDLILAARGGFGSVHILPDIDYAALRRRNLPVMGYSDITAIHCAMLAKNAGIPIAGSNLLQLDEVITDKASTTSHHLALQNDLPLQSLPFPELEAVNVQASEKTVSGHAYAGNLTVLSSLCGTEFMPDFSNFILIAEDVNEPVYKIDRMLEQLRLSGVLKNLQALIFGKFTGCDNSGGELSQLMTRFAGKLDCPCFKNFVFGHEFPMCAVNSSHKFTICAGRKLSISV